MKKWGGKTKKLSLFFFVCGDLAAGVIFPKHCPYSLFECQVFVRDVRVRDDVSFRSSNGDEVVIAC